MALAQEDFERLGDYVKSHISDWLAEQSLGKPAVVYEIELRERMVRVEEELRHQRELMREGFAQMDKRFEAMQKSMISASSKSTSASSKSTSALRASSRTFADCKPGWITSCGGLLLSPSAAPAS